MEKDIEFKKLIDRIEFLEEIIKKYLLTGQNQFESAYKDWGNNTGIFRSNKL